MRGFRDTVRHWRAVLGKCPTLGLAVAGLAGLMASCNTMRYVGEGQHLLVKNEVEIDGQHKSKRNERVTPGDLTRYVQQRPNSRLLGLPIYLGFYNMTDTSKKSGWHRFWREKVGEAPVIYDSLQNERSRHMMGVFLASKGYLDATVRDSVTFDKTDKKATVHYLVTENKPYRLSDVRYRITDTFLEPIILEDTAQSLVKTGMIFDRDVFDAERDRITGRLQNMGFWGFNKANITYTADTSAGDNTVALTMWVWRRTSVGANGEQVTENHPIYRIGQITVNSAYDPTKSEAELAALPWDTLSYNGVDIAYVDRVQLKPKLLVGALRLSPNELYDRSSVQHTYSNIRNLQYSANILFSEMPYDTLHPIEVTRAVGEGGQPVSTTERNLNCLIQAIPNVKQNFNVDVELSTTADYYSAALTLGYQNRNIFRGAENFTINFRGAYEFMKIKGKRNSYEFGVSTGLDIPRFWLPMSADRQSRFIQPKTNITLSYNIQRRPDYNRTIASAVFGYSWSLRNGARFQINPVDVNLVKVPWVDEKFLSEIENPYLRESYKPQLIAGISAAYAYQTNPDPKANSFNFRIMADMNGNLFYGIRALTGNRSVKNPGTPDEESYYKIFGIQFAQYARISFDISNRVNTTETTQFAWRFFVGGGIAYGNSKVLPFERLFFAGGSNSMRGWAVRTLGPGSTPYKKESYPNQLGDFRLEANLEYRFKVFGDFGMAIFTDAGNVWSNSKGSVEDARFRFNRFYKQIAWDTGLGFRYDAGFVLLRLDWGLKLHNPNVPRADRWNSGFKFKETAFHFAIGLPF